MICMATEIKYFASIGQILSLYSVVVRIIRWNFSNRTSKITGDSKTTGTLTSGSCQYKKIIYLLNTIFYFFIHHLLDWHPSSGWYIRHPLRKNRIQWLPTPQSPLNLSFQLKMSAVLFSHFPMIKYFHFILWIIIDKLG